jgi:putative ABC transport system permease protein
MRRADILRLALSALYQQKLRTALTTLGVLFGSFVLTFSLSSARGVQETIVREYSRYASLRQIDVSPSFAPTQTATNEDLIEVNGNPSPEKRHRLQHEIARREQRNTRAEDQINLSPERLELLRALPHVTAVDADVAIPGRAILDRKAEDIQIHSSKTDDAKMQSRIVAGSYLKDGDANSIVVSEYLLYRLGVVDDEAVRATLGKPMRLEYRTGGISKPNVFLMLFNANRNGLGKEEQQLLDKVVKSLPALVSKLDLGPGEKETLRRLLQPPAKPSEVEPQTLTKEFEIVGVMRGYAKDEHRANYLDWWQDDVDVVLPPDTAKAWFFESAPRRKYGVQRALVEVDSIDSVKETTAAITGMGLASNSLVDMIEREQFTYILLFGVMTCIAGVALLVAALGIINTMLMTVLERTREIGVMKAVGARHGHILAIFLFEGALIGLVGGLIGLLIAWAISLPAHAWVRSLVSERMKVNLTESIFVWPVWLIVGVPLFACLITTLAAVFPARRAASVDPIRALRHD